VGIVEDVKRANGAGRVRVRWINGTGGQWLDVHELCSGFMLGMDVQDVPRSRTRRTLGEGVVVETRRLGGCDQVLVDFPGRGERVWVPYENLRYIKGASHRFVLGQVRDGQEAEHARLKSLTYALQMWNENTGSLSRLEIDPLPHQIHLVHHILASGNLNWLIADDVGLGKTIEVGMLLAALEQRGMFRRILLVTPAGLVRQWQEELHHKFGFSEFLIYGDDFRINNPRHWKLYDKVIGSIDRLKADGHMNLVQQSGPWDLVVFDEAHRLSRRQWGRKYEAAQRFRLAAALRRMTDSILLLTGTPHQGMQDKFQALLELLRPELKDEIRRLALNPEILRDIVIRNHKADVTDVDGAFIFKGKTTRAIKIPLGDEARDFDHALRRYLREGYDAAARHKGTVGRAIGFTMTTYRKLAASSAAAIERALVRRLDRLREDRAAASIDPKEAAEPDQRYAGEWEELFETSEDEFFEGEMNMLRELIAGARALKVGDRKLAGFLDTLLPGLLEQEETTRVLVFTEYLATQDYLCAALTGRYGERAVALINGGQDYRAREAEIARFEDEAQFLISTEAGGEGLNLHRGCWIMVNFDLPWNPMRLVQRVGRLYRYGQQRRVLVLNVHAPQTIDAEIMGHLYARIGQVVHDLAPVGVEFRDGLEDEILGEVADVLDVDQILAEATSAGIQRTRERIEDALARARDAVEKQRELFEYAAGFDPAEARGELGITPAHTRAFVEGMFERLGVEILRRLHGGTVLELRLPEALLDELPGQSSRLRVTFDRERAASRSDLEMLDFHSRLFRHLIERAQAHRFGGVCASIAGFTGRALFTAMLRWQNDQGMRMRQEYTAVEVESDGRTVLNPQRFSEWLLESANAGGASGPRSEGEKLLQAGQDALDGRLAQIGNLNLHPENMPLVTASWCSDGAAS